MILNVNEIRQTENSTECGIACLNMILNYHDIKVDYNFIFDKLKDEFKNLGLSTPQLGKFLIDNFNLDVTIITLNPMLFSINEIKGNRDTLINRIEARKKTFKDSKNIEIADEFIEFLFAGGEINAEIPTINHIQNEIDLGNPLIAILNSNFLNGKLLFNFHFNVITGYDNEYFYTNDPMADETGGKKKHIKANFIYSIHSTSFGDLDNAALLLIKPK